MKNLSVIQTQFQAFFWLHFQAEINSAYKSLGTNIVISASLPFLSFLAYFFSADYFVILFIVSKTVISITTIIVNFGPIKQLVRSVVSLNKQDI